ncbi:MAG: class I SAM-dependent methyltransferase [Proteobacteria bacterium]|nr:class I SAM-dependent methyltransferase [Pseudomonadota bacterium]
MAFSEAVYHALFPHDRPHIAGFHQMVASHLGDGGCLLDLGCGDNRLLAPYRTPGREVWGVDFERHPRLDAPDWFRLLGPDGRIPFPDGTFDMVVSMFVMEHVTDGPAFLAEIARVLKPGGHFIGHSISGRHYLTWLRRAFGLLPHATNQMIVKKLYGRDEVDTFPAFYRLNSRASIERAAQGVGLVWLGMARYQDAGYFSFLPPLVPLGMAVDRALAFLPTDLGRLYFTAALRKSA